ncbi:helix-turn-helix domain-containing protein [Micromonospora sp. KC721]|uniref:helix-turn-helix domain-containing protein n=1 Tax=Micromonospora sp. KC721 TaxID=2530380 RepID=UPI0010491A2B|nr:helix-turn-helix domain-containing protein [Micromonospora sp. KC721]TDB70783.1 DNA-binding protein [Micromonospora sp. KC721]
MQRATVTPLHSTRTADAPTRTLRAADSRAVYSVREVARLLSLSLGSTYALVREGEIPARKLGGRWVIPKKRFHDWLNETTEQDNRASEGWA